MDNSTVTKQKQKKKKLKRQASKQTCGQQQASPPQLAQPEPAGSQPVVEQQAAVPDDEPLLEAHFPLPGGFTLARLNLAPNSAAGGLRTSCLVASPPCADVLDAASPLTSKRRGLESVSGAESSGTAEIPTADGLALVPLTPDDSHAPSLRRSSREHKKPKPYYAASRAEPPDKPSGSKGLMRGFFK